MKTTSLRFSGRVAGMASGASPKRIAAQPDFLAFRSSDATAKARILLRKRKIDTDGEHSACFGSGSSSDLRTVSYVSADTVLQP